ncbi:MAG TPA: YIP1 family protein [Methanoregulaceae archaeon]|nr:MAG: YIP1 family protein [Methanolinea sp.]HON81008.1 YIP1 family protein [Methanoregulaceae archaeon]HPD10206.1 YIP1 family protein [Methanoregulaceae archaeon]HRT14594.1 YIP1 family protein [Methanoregulaceae archaeon]HRU30165.1 YIP1 family protein [Methanoregulaceae archaeon]
MDYIELVRGMLFSPVETFQKVKTADLGDALKYFLILVLINTVLSVIISLVVLSSMWVVYSSIYESLGIVVPATIGAGMVAIAILMIFGSIFILFIAAAWLHLWVYILGGRKGYIETLKAIAYGATPELLIGWIPFIGFIGSIWSFILTILGVRELQEMSTGKAAAAAIIAVVVLAIIIILVAAFLFIAYMEMMQVPMNLY